MGYQGECMNCGWKGSHHEDHASAEAEAAEHANQCKRPPLSCEAGCVAGSRIRGGKWVPCENCNSKSESEVA